MKKSAVVAAGLAALVIGTSVGCSSDTAKPMAGVLPAGTAQFTVAGKNAGTTYAVRCDAVDSWVTIKTGDDATGATLMLSNKRRPEVEYVRLRNLSGFSGDYNLDLEGSAAVALVDTTYRITGTALGYHPTSIAPTTETFSIKVAC